MPQVPVYNQNGEKVGDTMLSPEVFEVAAPVDLIHQLVVAELANSRNSVAHTKTRGEVRGGGKKPWKQKGTGNARAGSIRSPLWKGGGVTFGPRSNRNYAKKVNRQMFRRGLFSVLSEKLASNKLFVIDKIALDKIKTKDLAGTLKQLNEKLHFTKPSTTIVVAQADKTVERSARNLRNLQILKVSDITPYKLLLQENTLLTRDAVSLIEKTFLNKK